MRVDPGPAVARLQRAAGNSRRHRLPLGWVLLAGLLAGGTDVTAATIYVSTAGADANDGRTWQLAKRTVVAGMAATVAGDQVWVAAGAYSGQVTLKSGVALYGGFAGQEASLAERDWVSHRSILETTNGVVVIVQSGATASTRIDGFTIRKGTGYTGGGISCEQASPTIANNLITGNRANQGGGIHCGSSSSPVIMNNVVQGNTATSGFGGGIVCLGGAPVLSGNTITDNQSEQAGGGVHCSGSGSTIANNYIVGNTSGSYNYSGVGGGVYVSGAGATITGNLIAGNTALAYRAGSSGMGGGIACNQAAAATIANNTITGNAAGSGGGGIYCTGGTGTIANNVITGNSALQAGGGVLSQCAMTITNNSMVGNVARYGGGCDYGSGSPTVSNNLIAFNSSGIHGASGVPVLRSNCVYNPDGDNYANLAPGIGDISVDPLLVAREYGQVHLAAGSPCIDAALDSAVGSGWQDIDGEARIQAAHADIGADEFNGTTPSFAPRVLRVRSDGDDARDGLTWASAKRTVQAAIAAAREAGGAEVWVASGVYPERIALQPWVHLYGGFAGTELTRDERDWKSHVTVLDGTSGGTVVTAVLGGCTSIVDGFTIRGGTVTATDGAGGGVYCHTSSPLLAHNILTGNVASSGYGGGVYCRASLATLTNNLFVGNSAGKEGGGIYCSAAAPIILNNTLVGNVAGANGGGIAGSGSYAVVANNIVAFNSSGLSATDSTTTLHHNCVYNPDGTNYSGLNPGINDISVDPQLVAAGFGQVHLLAGSPCIDAGDDLLAADADTDIDGQARVQGGHVEIGADEFDGQAPTFMPHVVRVSPLGNDANDGSSWALAKRTVQAGVDAAARPGGEVWVASSTYYERVDLKLWVYLYGGFVGDEAAREQRDWAARETILDGGNGENVVRVQAGHRACGLDGFTVRNSTRAQGTAGGAVYCFGAGPFLTNCTIKANQTTGVYAQNGSPLITRCTFTGNLSGAVYGSQSWLVVTDCLIQGNPGGGVTVNYGAPIVLRNTISENSSGVYCTSVLGTAQIEDNTIVRNLSAGGIYCYGSATIQNNRVVGNVNSRSEVAGGGISCSGSAVVANNIVIANSGTSSSARGGGITCFDGAPILTNNTVIGNAATDGGGIYNYKSSALIRNNIVAFNTSGIYSTSGAPTLAHNCVHNPGGYDYSGLSAGGSDIAVDPQVVAAAYGQVHLRADSPCVDAGLDSAAQAAWTDQDGQARIQGAHVDIGADEFNGTAPGFMPTIMHVSTGGDDGQDGASWATAKRTVQAGIAALGNAGGEVWVAAGTYPERLTLAPWVHVYGGFAGHETDREQRDWRVQEVVLDGGAAGTLVNMPAGSGLCTLDGFSLRNATGETVSGGGCLPTIAHNRILGSAGSGRGIRCDSNTRAMIDGNQVLGHSDFGVSCYQGMVVNNVISGNSTGGLSCGSVIVANNTIAGNSGTLGGGITCITNSSPTIINNIVAFNTYGIAASGGTPVLQHNCVYNPRGYDYAGLSAGADDISADPMLRAADYGQVQLLAGSPCIDTGADTGAPLGSTDLDGELRQQGAHVDIGADEFNGVAPPAYVPSIIRVASTGDDAADGSTWPAAKRTVQAGIDAATAAGGAEVWVAAGTYPERITLRLWVHLYGGFIGTESDRAQRNWRSQATVLDGQAGGSTVTITEGSSVCTIDGFTIRNGTGTANGNSPQGGGILCRASLATIAHNAIIGNFLIGDNARGAGIYCLSASPLIIGNTIADNGCVSTYSTAGGGIGCLYSNPTIVSNVIIANTARQGGGINWYGNGSASALWPPTLIANNTVVANSAVTVGGICCASPSPVRCANNLVAFNTSGISGAASAVASFDHNCVYNPAGENYIGLSPGVGDQSVDPRLLAADYGQVHLTADSPCIDAGADGVVQSGWADWDDEARIQGLHVDIGADEFNGTEPPFAPRTVRVHPLGNDANDGSSWASAKQTVQNAIDAVAATSGGEVWVAAGVYNEPILLRPRAQVFGGFIGTEEQRHQRDWRQHETVLDGGGNGSVVSALSGYRVSRIDGFTIRNGTGTLSGSSTVGGGIYCVASPIIVNNRITRNYADAYGGGIYCATTSAPIITNNTITGNCGASQGGGIYCIAFQAWVANNVISGNGGSGIYCAAPAGLVANNTLVANWGGISCSSSNVTITNNILAFNSYGIYNSGTTSGPALNHNCVYNPDGDNYTGVTAGVGDFSADPHFVAGAYGELHLLADSPCIDAGDDSVVTADAADVDGAPRISGGAVDVGADEFGAAAPGYTPIIVRVSPAGDDHHDGSNWELAKRTVQNGLDAAARNGGEVWVAAGLYPERIVVPPWTYLYGGFAGTEDSRDQRNWASHTSTLDGSVGGSVVTALAGHRVSAVDGFTIRNGTGNAWSSALYGGGLYCRASLLIAHNTIRGNSARYGGGVYATACAPLIRNNFIAGNGAIYGGGVCCGGLTEITNNTFVANSATHGGGFCNSTGSPVLTNNILAFNSSGLYQSGTTGTAALRANCVFNPDGANYTGMSPGAGDFSADPQSAAGAYADVHLAAGSPCIDAGRNEDAPAESVDIDGEPRIQGARVDIGADEFNGAPPPPVAPIFVRVSPSGDDAHDGSSWAMAKRSVQAGIDAAAEIGGEVWVAAGIYPERILLKPWTFAYGGFSGSELSREQRDWLTNTCVLDGAAEGSVVRVLSGHRVSGLDGFTVSNGIGTLVDSSRCGGGIYCLSSPFITNNLIVDSSATLGGGVYSSGASPIIRHNRILRNHASNSGGGVYCSGGAPRLADNLLIGNSGGGGGGLYCSSLDSTSTVANLLIVGNRATYGGGVYTANGILKLVNCACLENQAGAGGGAYFGTGSAVNLVNCTLARNVSSYGAGCYASGTASSLINCIVWGNAGPQIYSSYSGFTVRYSDVQDGWTGTGNIELDPLLARLPEAGSDGVWGTADDDLGDLRLQAGSPCIDAGQNSALPADVMVDLDGQGRFFNAPATPDCPWAPSTCGSAPIVDMGAYEFIAGDLDRDGDIDRDDLSLLQTCFSGPRRAAVSTCSYADLDGDGDVDQADFGFVQRCFSGASQPVDPACSK